MKYENRKLESVDCVDGRKKIYNMYRFVRDLRKKDQKKSGNWYERAKEKEMVKCLKGVIIVEKCKW